MRDTQREFQEMYEAAMPVVYGFLLLRSGGNISLAEDLTAETFTAAVQEYKAGRAEAVTISWLRTVAKRRLIDHWRREQIARSNSPQTDLAVASTELGLAERDQIVGALGQLREDERRALVLRHLEGYSVGEVADVLDRTPKATESLLGRARSAFRAAYREADHV